MTLLQNFLKGKKKETVAKTMNIDGIKKVVSSFAIDGRPQKKERLRKRSLGRAEETDKKRRAGSISFHSQDGDAAECGGNESSVLSERPFAVETGEQSMAAVEGGSELEDRRLKIVNHGTRSVEMPYSLVDATRFLPRSFKKISRLYKILETIFKFNRNRGLSLVLVKYKESIERLFGHPVETSHLEQIKFVVGGGIEFVPISILDNGTMTDTHNIKIAGDVDIDKLLYDHLTGVYRRWLQDREVVWNAKSMHRDFAVESLEVPRVPVDGRGEPSGTKVVGAGKTADDELNARKTAEDQLNARKAATTIYERIKEKERLRREAFVREQVSKEDYEGKIGSIFAVSKKRAVKLDELVFQFGGRIGSRERVLECLKDGYFVKKINGVEYVIMK